MKAKKTLKTEISPKNNFKFETQKNSEKLKNGFDRGIDYLDAEKLFLGKIKELKAELKNAGYLFYTQSDTEVILNAYKHWGQNCVTKFNGMWAFCIYDTKQQLCFASRDRFGVKPFYYLNNTAVFAFASTTSLISNNKV